MEAFVRAVYENEKDKLWHNKLKRLIRERYWPGISDSSFRCSKRKLIEESIVMIRIEELPSKSEAYGGTAVIRKELIHLTKAAKERYVFGNLQIPDTYLPRNEASVKELNTLQRLRKSRRRKETEESEIIRRGRIVHYYLLRAENGTTYIRRVSNREAHGQAGLITAYKDRSGKYLLPNTIGVRKKLEPITLEVITIPGVTVTDLVYRRDVGSGGYFRDVDTTKEECERIVQDLVHGDILVQVAYKEIHEALTKQNRLEYADPLLLKETRYKIATKALGRWISEINNLQYFVVNRIEMDNSRKIPHRSQLERDLYQYYFGPRELEPLKEKKERENDSMTEVPNGRKMSVSIHYERKVRRERKPWYWYADQKLKEVRNNKKYNQMRKKFPILSELLMKPLEDILEDARQREGR